MIDFYTFCELLPETIASMAWWEILIWPTAGAIGVASIILGSWLEYEEEIQISERIE